MRTLNVLAFAFLAASFVMSACGSSSDEASTSEPPESTEPVDCDEQTYCLEFTAEACEDNHSVGSRAPMTLTNTCDFPVRCRLQYWLATYSGGENGVTWRTLLANESIGSDGLKCELMELGEFYFSGYCLKTDVSSPTDRYDECEIPADDDLTALEHVREHCADADLVVEPSLQRGTCSLTLQECAKPGASSRDLKIECAPNSEPESNYSHICSCYEGDTKLKTFEHGEIPWSGLEYAQPVCDGEDVDRRLRTVLAGHCGLLTYSYDEEMQMYW